LHYLHDHPDSKDTLKGIAQWWLLREWTEKNLRMIEESLYILLSENLIVETRREGTQPYYELNRGKEERILEFLKIE
jgi:DNA-binding transcriptional ArsR family regulator